MMPETETSDTLERGAWQDRVVMVTGASGFLGRHLTRRLIGEGAIVHALSRSPRVSREPRLVWHPSDLTKAGETARAVASLRPDAVFHLSSLANGRRDIALVRDTFEAEVIATLNMLEACAGRGLRTFVFAGSLEQPLPGERPASPYGAAKAASQIYVDLFRTLYGLPAVSARIFMCYGPGQPAWKLIPALIAELQAGRSPRIASPERAVDWIFIEDAVSGLMAAAKAGEAGGPLAAAAAAAPEDRDAMTVDIGTGRLTPIREVAQLLRNLVRPELQLELSEAAPQVVEVVRRADAGRSERLTGWRARTGLAAGLRATLAAFEPGPDPLPPPLETPKPPFRSQP